MTARLHSALFVISLAIAVVVVAVRPGGGIDDQGDYAAHYGPTARNVLAGHGITDDTRQPELRYPPGYPLVLAGTFWVARRVDVSERPAISALNVVLMGVSSLLVLRLATGIWGARLALLPWVAWTTYPFVLYLLTGPTSEMPFIVAFIAALCPIAGIVRREEVSSWQFIASGMLAGCAMLIRPIAIGLGFVLALLIVAGAPRRRLLAATLLLAGNLLVVMPWEIWAYHATGQIIALSTGDIASMRDGLTFGVRLKTFRTGTWMPDASVRVMQDINNQYPSLVNKRAIGRVLSRELAERPLGVLELMAMKIARAWYGTDSQHGERISLLIQVVYVFVFGLATTVAWQAGAHQRRLVIGVWVVTFYFWAMTVLSLSILRYMVPAMSLLMLLLPALVLNGRGRQTPTTATDLSSR